MSTATMITLQTRKRRKLKDETEYGERGNDKLTVGSKQRNDD